jgi:hypothetical protein
MEGTYVQTPYLPASLGKFSRKETVLTFSFARFPPTLPFPDLKQGQHLSRT